MADVKISELPAATDFSGADLSGVQSGATKKFSRQIVGQYMVAIWAEEADVLTDTTYQWAFGNGANSPSNTGVTVYVPTGYECHIVAMTATTDNASGSSVIEAEINGTLQGSACNVTLSGRSGVNDSFTPVSISSGSRLNFRTTTGGTGTSPNIITAWLRYRPT